MQRICICLADATATQLFLNLLKLKRLACISEFWYQLIQVVTEKKLLNKYPINPLFVYFKAEEELAEAKSIYDIINSELHSELPLLHSRYAS